MKKITKSAVLSMWSQIPHRQCFNYNSTPSKDEKRNIFSTKLEGVKKIFEAQTGLELTQDEVSNKFECFLDSDEKRAIVQEWESKQGKLVYLRDCLSLSIAVDSTNFPSEYVDMACSVKYCNLKQNDVEQLVKIVSEKIQSLPFYKDADLICSVPDFYGILYPNFYKLSSVTDLISDKVGKKNITRGFVYNEQHPSAENPQYPENPTFEEKWCACEKTNISYQNNLDFSVHGKSIILLQYEYISGVTLQYIAMKLQAAGANEVYGLSFVKKRFIEFDMPVISRTRVHRERKKEPRRKCFYNKSGVFRNKPKPTFSVAIKSAAKIFQAQTGQSLNYGLRYNNYWKYMHHKHWEYVYRRYWKYVSAEEIEQIKEWERNQKSLIYLQDCLSLSIALDTNFIDNKRLEYTEIGNLEKMGKKTGDQKAINQLADIVSRVIQYLPFYKDADLICSVPPKPDKDFDLPSSVTKLVSDKVGKQDVTGGFAFSGQKSFIKNASLEDKWYIWEGAQVSFQKSQALDLYDKTIILIDDKYQSGVTIQYIAMKLQQAGANEVYGLSFVKTLSDKDNVKKYE